MGEGLIKHKHLRGPVLKYFLTHTWPETKKRFGLSESELKSLFTRAYRLPEFRHLRKDKRNHAPWTKRELVFLLTHSGLRDRDWIAKHIGRGNRRCIKERLQALGLASRNMQGLTLSQFIKAFGKRPEFFLQTLAGPRRASAAPTLWKIVPWVWLDAEIKEKRLKIQKEMRAYIRAMATFQEWIFGGNSLRKMKRICRKSYKARRPGGGVMETIISTKADNGNNSFQYGNLVKVARKILEEK